LLSSLLSIFSTNADVDGGYASFYIFWNVTWGAVPLATFGRINPPAPPSKNGISFEITRALFHYLPCTCSRRALLPLEHFLTLDILSCGCCASIVSWEFDLERRHHRYEEDCAPDFCRTLPTFCALLCFARTDEFCDSVIRSFLRLLLC
jgi:hypothetical protein